MALLATLVATGFAAAATTTVVSLDPATDSLDQGSQTTVDIVVEDVDGGVGAYEATVTVADADVARITNVSIADSPDLQDVTISEDGSTATVNAALMNVTGDEAVIGTVTVDGAGSGTTDVSISVDALGDRDGKSYEVSETEGATLSVSDSTGSGGGNSGGSSGGGGGSGWSGPSGSSDDTTETTDSPGQGDSDDQTGTDDQAGTDDRTGTDDGETGTDTQRDRDTESTDTRTSATNDGESASYDREAADDVPDTQTEAAPSGIAGVPIPIVIGVGILFVLGVIAVRRL